MRSAGRGLVMTLVVCLAGAHAAAAQTIIDKRVWFTGTVQERPRPESRWRPSFDVSIRSRMGVSELDIVNLRPVLVYALGSHSTVGGGYALVTNFPVTGGHFFEHRIFSHYGWSGAVSGGTLAYRARLEARFLEGNGVAWRLRQQLRFTRALRPHGRTALTAYDEFFIHFNDTGRTAQGIDQNRAFGGLSFTLNPTSRMEAGYLNQFSPGHRGVVNRMNHVLSTSLVLSF